MAKEKKRFKVTGWIPELEVEVEEWTWSGNEENAKRSVIIRKDYPRWAIVHLEACEVPSTKQEKPTQQKLF